MSARPDIGVLHHAHDRMGESPLWDTARACLWWVDIAGKAVRRFAFAAKRVESFAADEPPGALAVCEDGSLIAVLAIETSLTGSPQPNARAAEPSMIS